MIKTKDITGTVLVNDFKGFYRSVLLDILKNLFLRKKQKRCRRACNCKYTIFLNLCFKTYCIKTIHLSKTLVKTIFVVNETISSTTVNPKIILTTLLFNDTSVEIPKICNKNLLNPRWTNNYTSHLITSK